MEKITELRLKTACFWQKNAETGPKWVKPGFYAKKISFDGGCKRIF